MDASPRLTRFAEYAGAAALCVLLLICVLDLTHADLSVPLEYDGDALSATFFVKTVLRAGWYLHNDDVGAPHGLDMHDYSICETLHFSLIRVLGVFSSDPFFVMNVYFLLTFVLTTLTSLAVLRYLQCWYPTALVGSLLFAFLPYHFFRGIAHIFLAAYFLVPLLVLVMIWLYRSNELGGRRFWLAVGICALASTSDVYYSFFACLLIGIAGLAGAWHRAAVKPFFIALALIAIIGVGTIVNVLPTFLYAREHGANPEASVRFMGEAEHFGLRISQLLMPVTGHRLSFLAHLKARFNAKLMLVTENDFASLGMLGSVGFLLLLARLLKKRSTDGPSTEEAMSVLNVFAVLVSTIGGFGLLFAAALPQIRSYNRMSVFIGFFALAALVFFLERCRERLVTTRRGKIVFLGFLTVLLIAGVLDQTPGQWSVPNRHAERFHDDGAFVKRIEQALPDGALVYQLPYTPFPEGGSYEPLRGYLHSDRLRWSFGAMRGRPADSWQRRLEALSVDQLLPTLALTDFRAIVLDRKLCGANASALESELAQWLEQTPVVSGDGRLVFFNLTPYATAMREKLGDSAWLAKREKALNPVVVTWGRGFYLGPDLKALGGRWCAARGELALVNLAAEPQSVTVTMTLRTGFAEDARLVISGAIVNREIVINDKAGELVSSLNIPPGRHVVRVSCDAQAYQANPRRIFRVVDYKIE